MGVSNAGAPNQSMSDWMRDIEKRLMHEERRPSVAPATNVVGFGVGTYARLADDWNATGPVTNGWYYSYGDQVVNSPDDTLDWIGMVVADPDGHGFQQVWEYVENISPGEDVTGTPVTGAAQYTRSFITNADGGRTYSPWTAGGGGGGGGIAGIVVQDENITLTAAATTLDFQGGGVQASGAGSEVVVTVDGTPMGPAGGDLTGTYPDPEIRAGVVTTTEIADDTILLTDLSATGTKDTTTFLRGDNTWAVPPDRGGTITCTSTTRPSAPALGDEIYETNTHGSYYWNGTAWQRLGPEVYYQNTPTVNDAAGLNFFGAGVTVANDGVGNATITIPGGGADGSYKGIWNSATNYVAGDTVQFGPHYYGTAVNRPATSPDFYADDFTTLSSNWVATSAGTLPVYTISAGKAQCSTAGTFIAGAASAAMLVDTAANIHSIQMELSRTSTTGTSVLWISYQDANNWATWRNAGGTAGFLQYKIAGGTVVQVAANLPAAWFPGTITVKAVVAADMTITLSVGGVTFHTQPMTAFVGTKVGFGDSANNTTGLWDNALVTPGLPVVFNPADWTYIATKSPTVDADTTATNGANLTGTVSVARRGQMVSVNVGQLSGAAIASLATLHTLPVGYRPAATHYGVLVLANGAANEPALRITVQPTGVVEYAGVVSIPTGTNVRGSYVFPLPLA